jgi:hypothetical protein
MTRTRILPSLLTRGFRPLPPSLFGAASYVNGAVIPADGSASAVDVGMLPPDRRDDIRRQDGS